MATQERLHYLLKQLQEQTASAEEYRELRTLLNADKGSRVLSALDALYNTDDTAFIDDAAFRTPYWAGAFQAVLLADQSDTARAGMTLVDAPGVYRNMPQRKTAWLRYAAVLVLIAGTATYLYRNAVRPLQESVRNLPANKQADILPGGDKAVLTLSDGSKVVLDSAANGTLASQGNTFIQKIAGGQIIYQAGHDSPGNSVTYNTLSTPKGGQYQLKLQDGTDVWLNAASSITYPTVFSGKDRTVSITGEVYFEVAQHSSLPFSVQVNGRNMVWVLGTSFNVNAYVNEPFVKVSLLDGAVKIDDKILKPGQAYINGKITATDTELDIAWKNGMQVFRNADIPAIMRQVERWYSVTVEYSGKAPANLTFTGEIPRAVPLSQLLKMLESPGVRLVMNEDQHKITVTYL